MARGNKKLTPPVADETAAWQKQAASAFKALSDPTRLQIFHLLRCPREGETEVGITVGQICERLLDGGTGSSKDPSTISHHLKELRQAGLITMERDGQHRRCFVNDATLTQLSEYLHPAGALRAITVSHLVKTADAPAPLLRTKKAAKP